VTGVGSLMDRSVLRSTSAHVLVDAETARRVRMGSRSTTHRTPPAQGAAAARRRHGRCHRWRGRWCLATRVRDGHTLRLAPRHRSSSRPHRSSTDHDRCRDPKGRPSRLDGAEGDRARRRSPRVAPRRALGGALESGSGRTSSERAQRIADEALASEPTGLFRLRSTLPFRAWTCSVATPSPSPVGDRSRWVTCRSRSDPRAGGARPKLAGGDRVDLGPRSCGPRRPRSPFPHSASHSTAEAPVYHWAHCYPRVT
jgi:hypothetical protein